MKALRCITLAFAMLCLLTTVAYAEERVYTHGHLQYTSQDSSVTIVGYNGSEETVVVPNMLGGNPVNTIASNAFANNTKVRVVMLPDCVTKVEEGAVGVGQAVVYDYNIDYEYGNNQPNDHADEEASTGNEDNASSTDPVRDVGIHISDGGLLTTDDENNLIVVKPNGTEMVLDDSIDYTRVYKDDGSFDIVNENGIQVGISQDGTVVAYVDDGGRSVSYDVVEDSTSISTVPGATSASTAQADENVESVMSVNESSNGIVRIEDIDSGKQNTQQKDKADQTNGANDSASQQQPESQEDKASKNTEHDESNPIVFIAIAVVLLAAIGAIVTLKAVKSRK